VALAIAMTSMQEHVTVHSQDSYFHPKTDSAAQIAFNDKLE